ncbi:hypothetical protein ACFE04_031702 [Oxalis oulophora]
MATHGDNDVEEYESDPDEIKRSLGMRRREASSDDDEEDESRTDRRAAAIRSDESDGQGGAADYGEDDDDFEEVEEEIYDEVDQERHNSEGERVDGYKVNGTNELGRSEVVGDDEGSNNGEGRAPEAGEEEKKENEPYAVPTAGAFYMHDDRFRAKGNLRPSRRTQGGRSLWESKEDTKWGHDKFEEVNTHERKYDEGRRGTPRGRYRARGRNRDSDRSYPRENRGSDRSFPRENRDSDRSHLRENRYSDRSHPRENKSRDFNHNENQNQTSKGFRGRGPRRYDPSMKNTSQAPPTHNKQSRKSLEKTSHTNSGRAFSTAKNVNTGPTPSANQVFASSLSSASPPFYPSGSSNNKDVAFTQKRDVHVHSGGGGGRNSRPSGTDESSLGSQANASSRGKNIVDSIGMDKLYGNDSYQGTHPRSQGRGVAAGGQVTAYRPVAPQMQGNRHSSHSEYQPVQRNSAQNQVQSSVQAPPKQLGQRSPPKTATSTNSYEHVEMIESLSELSISKGGKGKGSVVQGNGRGSFMYGGTQVMGSTGNMAVGRGGDQNFPTFLPMMQFGGAQHPGGIGVPAVGMAFPGYVGGGGNSEMTWLPVLTGAGGPYSPYFSMDALNNPRPSAPASSTGSSSKENITNEPNNEWKASQRHEQPVTEEPGQRQNKQTRRDELRPVKPGHKLSKPLKVVFMYDKHLVMLLQQHEKAIVA